MPAFHSRIDAHFLETLHQLGNPQAFISMGGEEGRWRAAENAILFAAAVAWSSAPGAAAATIFTPARAIRDLIATWVLGWSRSPDEIDARMRADLERHAHGRDVARPLLAANPALALPLPTPRLGPDDVRRFARAVHAAHSAAHSARRAAALRRGGALVVVTVARAASLREMREAPAPVQRALPWVWRVDLLQQRLREAELRLRDAQRRLSEQRLTTAHAWRLARAPCAHDAGHAERGRRRGRDDEQDEQLGASPAGDSSSSSSSSEATAAPAPKRRRGEPAASSSTAAAAPPAAGAPATVAMAVDDSGRGAGSSRADPEDRGDGVEVLLRAARHVASDAAVGAEEAAAAAAGAEAGDGMEEGTDENNEDDELISIDSDEEEVVVVEEEQNDEDEDGGDDAVALYRAPEDDDEEDDGAPDDDGRPMEDELARRRNPRADALRRDEVARRCRAGTPATTRPASVAIVVGTAVRGTGSAADPITVDATASAAVPALVVAAAAGGGGAEDPIHVDVPLPPLPLLRARATMSAVASVAPAMPLAPPPVRGRTFAAAAALAFDDRRARAFELRCGPPGLYGPPPVARRVDLCDVVVPIGHVRNIIAIDVAAWMVASPADAAVADDERAARRRVVRPLLAQLGPVELAHAEIVAL